MDISLVDARTEMMSAVDGLFDRFRTGTLKPEDYADITELTVDANPEGADYWLASKEIYEIDVLPFRHLNDTESVILDVGAHLGYTAATIRNLPVRNHIHSFEPFIVCHPVLDRLAAIDPKFTYSRLACSDHSGTVDAYNLVVNGNLIGGTTTIRGATFASWFSTYLSGRVGEQMIPLVDRYEARVLRADFETVRLDDMLLPNAPWRHHGRRIVGLKIDVEGHELSAVAGAQRILREHQPLVMIEITDFASMKEAMADVGYRPFERVEDKIRPVQNIHYNTYYVHDDMLEHYRRIGLIA
ncbi:MULTISPECIES: FkbM family methyltransferase [unclassified Mesorhizobium]|uniref:FkbM family methyltransferase n=1 Tax=unclassified Mesorhizobium TaxID=325217 RepID=UPI00112AB1F5|nr:MULTISPECIES: FkbM family methyltransferase [unclassified Mesorhizobium]TPJ86968.1 FkbM family methyltransferase [Mesorhizobium sp. B2-5-12]TPK19191.1 FkbM family methyltransferase [Mesorhizobium sp. B2-5-6]